MSQKIVALCDRCQEEIKNQETARHVKVYHFRPMELYVGAVPTMPVQEGDVMDLCGNCVLDLQNFFRAYPKGRPMAKGGERA